MNRCNICLDEACKGAHNCSCENCKNVDMCYKFLHPTIRITNKCTQSCSHCCFTSSPDSKIMMTIEKAKEIARFCNNNNIKSINVMGGEFFCNKKWLRIIDILAEKMVITRLVSNGDWANNDDVKSGIKYLVDKYDNRLIISISYDKWHTNRYSKKAYEFLQSINAKTNIETNETSNDNAIVPLGRSYLDSGLYGTFACYCHNQRNMYSFLIDEEGNIYKCPFGVWNYANITDYIKGGFDKRFKEFNKKFYKCFISSCRSCERIASREDNNIVLNK